MLDLENTYRQKIINNSDTNLLLGVLIALSDKVSWEVVKAAVKKFF
jgi:hypothetical protein